MKQITWAYIFWLLYALRTHSKCFEVILEFLGPKILNYNTKNQSKYYENVKNGQISGFIHGICDCGWLNTGLGGLCRKVRVQIGFKRCWLWNLMIFPQAYSDVQSMVHLDLNRLQLLIYWRQQCLETKFEISMSKLPQVQIFLFLA